MNTRSFIVRAALVAAVFACCLVNVSCVGQRIKDPVTGQDIVQITAFARAKIDKKPDGSFTMSANAEKAAERFGDYLQFLKTTELVGKGIDATAKGVKTIVEEDN